MSEPFIAEIRIFPYTFAPRGWAYCDGQLLSISQNEALFSLLGTTYGGNGQTTFALPNLKGRAVLSPGTGPGLPTYQLGQMGGAPSVGLTAAEIPPHSHRVTVLRAVGTTDDPTNAFVAGFRSNRLYDRDPDPSDFVPMSQSALAVSGASQPHENRQPILYLNFCIALFGIYPSRN